MGTLLLIIVLVALWLSIMALAAILPINVNILRITQPLICPPGSHLELRTWDVSPHHRGVKGLMVYSQGPDGRRDVKTRALLALWAIFFVISLFICGILGLFFGQQVLALFSD